MRTRKLFTFGFFICSFILIFCQDPRVRHDPRLVGGPCEGCEAVFEYGDRRLTPVDTLPDFHSGGQQIKVTGTIYRADGKTPAPDVVLYVYHTDGSGLYSKRGDEKGWGRRHGYNRGWIKTDQKGRYTFFTIKPGTYPDGTEPAHIHPTILEPDGKYYWLESYYFEGDPLLTEKETHPPSPRGGSNGILRLSMKGNLWVGERDFILGKNMPDYRSP
ncbi:protocatechuate 3,4-dioxygenase beta subunit [Muriicola jejuensis]|uniref:Intradiol ring-cleavage dioxygenase n=1 Tax=Muriicola jejuensis TaxID=504488 RepID=A0A6P0UMF7_9FLAO|nr:intradiol ring-cleavage dioxygenase [Muriicola jejuensis]NER11446.1 intradiol ring-cleavage dioxygenase [Muriicola jejuensis]SMP20739.1 protocatechuate 3,4-dioxygenase beta subunit [Muriicola jejuensis]